MVIKLMWPKHKYNHGFTEEMATWLKLTISRADMDSNFYYPEHNLRIS